MIPGDGIARNLRYLLWKEGVGRDRWGDRVAVWAACSRPRAAAILEGASPTSAELQELVSSTGFPEEELQYQDLTAGLDVLRENLRFLLEDLPHGDKGRLAADIGVGAGTLSGWLAGTPPRRENLARLKSHFGLPPDTDLAREPLFLSLHPVSDRERRSWLHKQIDAMSGEELKALFPALRKLLRQD